MFEIDQAKTLRDIMDPSPRIPSDSRHSMRVISVTSGKGGVGKTSVVTNLAVSLSQKGKRVLLLDGDFGLANLDILWDIKPKYNLHDVLYNNLNISDVIVNVAPGIDIIPASSGIMEMTNLGLEEKSRMLDFMQELESKYDTLIIDTGAGINSDVTWLNASAGEVMVVVTPEPTSITDAYALIKVLNQRCKLKQFKLLINQAVNEAEALRVYQKITSVADRFLNVSIDYSGFIIWDESMKHSVRMRKPMISMSPHSQAAKNFKTLADHIYKEKTQEFGNVQFFWKALVGHA